MKRIVLVTLFCILINRINAHNNAIIHLSSGQKHRFCLPISGRRPEIHEQHKTYVHLRCKKQAVGGTHCCSLKGEETPGPIAVFQKKETGRNEILFHVQIKK